jgi:hypothetical protein
MTSEQEQYTYSRLLEWLAADPLLLDGRKPNRKVWVDFEAYKGSLSFSAHLQDDNQKVHHSVGWKEVDAIHGALWSAGVIR